MELIEYSRSNAKILDREGLESTACDCYRLLKVRVARQGETELRVNLVCDRHHVGQKEVKFNVIRLSDCHAGT
jgi:hypothetical protein